MSEKNFKPAVEGKSLTFIKPSKLAEENVTGTILEGVFVAAIDNQMTGKQDYKFELADGNLVVLNGAGNLGYQMKSVTPGSLTRIDYLGKSVIKSGPREGKEAHGFKVMIAAD